MVKKIGTKIAPKPKKAAPGGGKGSPAAKPAAKTMAAKPKRAATAALAKSDASQSGPTPSTLAEFGASQSGQI